MSKTDTSLATYSSSEIDRRLKRNRVELQDYLQDGRIPPKKGASGFQKAIRALDDALGAKKDWAVRMALEYAVGRSAQYLQMLQNEDDGAIDGLDVTEFRETVSVSRTRRMAAPKGPSNGILDAQGGH